MKPQEFSQYRQELSALALRGLTDAASGSVPPAAWSAGTPRLTVALAIPAARLLLADEPALYAELASGLHALAQAGPNPRLADPAGHYRDVYDPLVLHLHLAAFSRRFESLPQPVWGRCQAALAGATAGARAVEQAAGGAPAAAQTGVFLWRALCLAEAAGLESRDVDLELVEGLVHGVLESQGPHGALHPMDPHESLDAWTYTELAGLHALANLALLRRNAHWARRVEEIAKYHLENTQPDHTSNQPWGLFAFLWPETTRSFGEQQIHDATAQGAAPPGLVASLLLADAADALGRFTR